MTQLPKPLWILLIITAFSALAVQYFVPAKSYFVFDSEPTFFAVVGIVVPFLLVIISRIAGFVLHRQPDFWRLPLRRQEEKDL